MRIVDKMIEAQVHVPEPSLIEDLLQELELKLRDLQGKTVILRYWDSGYEHQLECVIVYIDDWSRTVTTIKADRVTTVQIEHIYSMDKYNYLDEI